MPTGIAMFIKIKLEVALQQPNPVSPTGNLRIPEEERFILVQEVVILHKQQWK